MSFQNRYFDTGKRNRAQLGVTLPREMIERVKKEAAMQQITLADYIAKVLTDYFHNEDTTKELEEHLKDTITQQEGGQQ